MCIRDSFWGGVSLSASAWDAAGEWLAVPYRGATYFCLLYTSRCV